jgi:hypothetical protein
MSKKVVRSFSDNSAEAQIKIDKLISKSNGKYFFLKRKYLNPAVSIYMKYRSLV